MGYFLKDEHVTLAFNSSTQRQIDMNSKASQDYLVRLFPLKEKKITTLGRRIEVGMELEGVRGGT